MARDVLAIPISTVPFKSAFSIGGNVLNPFCSSFNSSTVKVLICARDWLRRLTNPLIVEDYLEGFETFEDNIMSCNIYFVNY